MATSDRSPISLLNDQDLGQSGSNRQQSSR